MTIPLLIGLVNAGVFVGLIFYLLSVNWWVDHTNRVLAQAHLVEKLIVDSETGLRGYALTGEQEFLEPYEEAKAQLPVEFEALKVLVKDSPAQSSRVAEIEEIYLQWLDYAAEIRLAVGVRGGLDRIVGKQRGKRLTDSIRTQFQRFFTEEEAVRNQRAQEASRAAYLLVIVFIVLSLLASVAVAWIGRRQLTSLAGAYEDSLRVQIEQNKALEAEQWLNAGETEVSTAIVGELKLGVLCEKLMATLSRYVGADVGVMYASDGSRFLERMAAVASPVTHPRKTKLEYGESLVGRAAQEARLVELREVPPGYLDVSSALGSHSPARILAAPMVSSGVVHGVVELGFLQDPEPRVSELLRRLSDPLAMAIKAARYRDQLEKYLEEMQAQAEELQTQQEELRVSNEELEEQSRLLKETQAQMESQQTELEQTNTQLERQARTLEEQKDALDRKNADLVRAQSELESKAAELRTSSRYKSEFLANMSHELRTPLNSSLILAKLLADNKQGNLTSQQVEYARQITSSGNDLLALINDILDLSKVESGKLEIIPEEFKVAELLEGLEKTFRPIALERKIEFTVECEPRVPVTIRSDRQRVEQILKNLLSNAMKFTPEKGRVTLKAVAEGADVRFDVEDTGIGIAPDQQTIIFEAFRQADGTTNRKYGGTGLGLSISRDLARRLGGAITVKSELNVGSTFSLKLPPRYRESIPEPSAEARPSSVAVSRVEASVGLAAGATRGAPPAPSRFLADDRGSLQPGERAILAIEDDAPFARILADLAREMDFKVLVSDTADEGLELARRFLPDAILLDIQLPDHSGLFVLDALKQSARTRHIPVHVISARDFSTQALRMGAVGYEVKPVERDEIKKVLEGLRERLSRDVDRVLVVEDDEVQRRAICALIGDEKVKIQTAGAGKEALEFLRTGTFDCMIMDLNLPDMSGFELLEKMKALEESTPPVIVYTGRELSSDEELRLRRHSRSVIIKGAKSPERLLDEVTLFLHRVESRLAPDRQKILESLRHRERLLEGRKILVVDDDMRNVFALTAALEQKGAQVLIARNGAESLTQLQANPDADLILMDIMMPVMDGVEAMRRIRSEERFRHLPIIALTAKAMRDDRESSLQAGASDYMTKPVDVEKLISLIRVWLSQSGGRQHGSHL